MQELIARLTELENQNKELKERLSTFEHSSPHSVNKKTKKNNEPKLKKKKAFDFSRYKIMDMPLFGNIGSRLPLTPSDIPVHFTIIRSTPPAPPVNGTNFLCGGSTLAYQC